MRCEKAFLYPVGVNGVCGELDVAYIDVDACPGLLSKKALQQIGITLHLEDDTYSVRNAGDRRPITNSEHGHPLLDVSSFGSDLCKMPTKYLRKTPEVQSIYLAEGDTEYEGESF